MDQSSYNCHVLHCHGRNRYRLQLYWSVNGIPLRSDGESYSRLGSINADS